MPRAVIVDDDVRRQIRLRMSRGLAPMHPVTLAWGAQVAPLVDLVAPRVLVVTPPHDPAQLESLLESLGGRQMTVILVTAGPPSDRKRFEARGVTVVAREEEIDIAVRASAPSVSEGAAEPRASLVLHFDSVTVDLERGEVIREGERARMAPREHALLALLAQHSGQTVSRAEILRDVWADRPAASRVVDRHVVALRRRIERDPRRPKYLLTVFARGYRLAI